MYCIKCGGNNGEGTTYCVSCGSPLFEGDQPDNSAINVGNSVNSDGYGGYNQDDNKVSEASVPFKEWLLMIFITSIPLVNIIMLIIWGFKGGSSKSKSNWSKAMLVWVAVSGAIGWLICLGIASMIITAIQTGEDVYYGFSFGL